MSAVFMEVARVGRAGLLTEIMQTHCCWCTTGCPLLWSLLSLGDTAMCPFGLQLPLSVHLPSLMRRTLGHSCLHLPSAVSHRDVCRAILFLLQPSACIAVPCPGLSIFPAILGLGRESKAGWGRTNAVCKGGVGKQLLTLRSCFCSWNESAFFQAFCLSPPPKAEVLQLTGLSVIAEEPQTGSAAAFTLLYVWHTWKCRDGVHQKKTERGKMGQNW